MERNFGPQLLARTGGTCENERIYSNQNLIHHMSLHLPVSKGTLLVLSFGDFYSLCTRSFQFQVAVSA